MNEASKSILKKSILLLLVIAIGITAVCAALSYDEIEEISALEQVVDGMNCLQSQKTVMKSGESIELLCSYSLEPLSEEDNVYILRLNLYQSDSAGSYDIKNIKASIQLPEGTISRMAYNSDGSEVSKSDITYNDGCEVVICAGDNSIDAEILLTGEVGARLDVVVSYDIIGSGRRMLMKFHDEVATFELNM
ncbi:MAG: hypothetical protein LUH03_02885 [Oscillospiraceae bacterium]|nr:hypothetical protein [Oscillospiraceae bacterium]